MQLSGQKSSLSVKSFWQKQMPTMFGLGVLVVALVAGLVMFGTGTGVFAPRATPQTTPKQVKITNIGDKSFTVSFYTDEATAGFIKYGTEEADLKSQSSDDRDQLAGSVGKFNLHHITVKGLKPNSVYFFTLGTGSGAVFDNNGAPFSIKTAIDPGTPPPAAKTVYGSIMTPGGTPADGSVVYLVAEGGNELSALVKSSGSWAISLASARTADGAGYLEVSDETPLTIFVQGTVLTQSAQVNTTVAEAQPLPDLSLAVGGGTITTDTLPADDELATKSAEVATDSATAKIGSSETASGSTTATKSASSLGGLDDDSTATSTAKTTASGSATATASPSGVLDLEALAASPTKDAVVVEAPIIIGNAAPRVKVKIEVHSETEIIQTVTADESGNFELDLSQFQDLEPGEHTVTYSYIDPATGEEITKTQTFTVAAPANQQLALAPLGASAPTTAPSPTPTTAAYGSGNPYPITSPTKASTTSGTTDTSTRSAVVSTTSGSYKAGSVGTTVALIGGGIFLMAIGWWSWWLAGLAKDEA